MLINGHLAIPISEVAALLPPSLRRCFSPITGDLHMSRGRHLQRVALRKVWSDGYWYTTQPWIADAVAACTTPPTVPPGESLEPFTLYAAAGV